MMSQKPEGGTLSTVVCKDGAAHLSAPISCDQPACWAEHRQKTGPMLVRVQWQVGTGHELNDVG